MKNQLTVCVYSAQMLQKETGDGSRNKCGNQCTLADTLNGTEAGHGNDGGETYETDIVGSLHPAELDMKMTGYGVYNSLTGSMSTLAIPCTATPKAISVVPMRSGSSCRK